MGKGCMGRRGIEADLIGSWAQFSPLLRLLGLLPEWFWNSECAVYCGTVPRTVFQGLYAFLFWGLSAHRKCTREISEGGNLGPSRRLPPGRLQQWYTDDGTNKTEPFQQWNKRYAIKSPQKSKRALRASMTFFSGHRHGRDYPWPIRARACPSPQCNFINTALSFQQNANWQWKVT